MIFSRAVRSWPREYHWWVLGPSTWHDTVFKLQPRWIVRARCRANSAHSSTMFTQMSNTDALCRKAQSRLYFLRRLASFNVCKEMLMMFYRSVVESALFFVVACWGGSIKKRDALRLDKLVRKAASVVGKELESMTSVAERRALSRFRSIMENPEYPLHCTIQR